LNLSSYLSLFFIAFGFIFIFISIFHFKVIVSKVQDLLYSSEEKEIIFHFKNYKYLMLFFAAGYLAVSFLIVSKMYFFGEVLVGLIFFFGGIFVYISNILQNKVLDSVKKEQKSLEMKNIQLEQTENVTIYALAYQAEMRDLETGYHLEKTAGYTAIIADELSKLPKYSSYLTQDYIIDLVKASPLHDIGKVGVPDSILKKPDKLTDEEFTIMKKHSEYGAEILRRAEEKLKFKNFLSLAIDLVEYHHEKWDGTGYPSGLKGEEIPLSARIMAIADVYDAIRSKRCYKKGYSHEITADIIKRERGFHFDPDVVDAFINTEDQFKKISMELGD
jgi:response regulator RpfG family c-di-GMP phosphodiesterase